MSRYVLRDRNGQTLRVLAGNVMQGLPALRTEALAIGGEVIKQKRQISQHAGPPAKSHHKDHRSPVTEHRGRAPVGRLVPGLAEGIRARRGLQRRIAAHSGVTPQTVNEQVGHGRYGAAVLRAIRELAPELVEP